MPRMTITLISALLAIACYLGSAVLIANRLFGGAMGTVSSRAPGLLLAWAGLALHALLLYHDIHGGERINLGFFIAGSMIAWTILLVLMLSALTKPVENLGIALLPAAVLAIGAELAIPSAHLLPADAPWGLHLHVLISLLAYSLLALASVQAILLAIQDRHLHNRHPGGFIRSLPPLQTMELLLFEMIGFGFLLLTAALVSGFLFLENMFAQHIAHKTILSIAAWCVFGALLWGRWRYGWRGRRALGWTLSGFLVLMVAYFGSKLVREFILGG